ncbi:hypothetical protein IAQ61_006033 [Plenodomus lingam]|uniref:uncharacterized protein n=1 Tax=Leptosphaeria maculans TaxID=5022 RepID=UPI00332D72F4|nr:hypothetical protein IAQ61_006033 [Plenodomus lingam]
MDALPITKKLIAFGSKKIYLPKFTIALIRTPRLSPYHARFLVPLDFSKYDLRDYLYHAYNVRCFNLRSYVKQMPVRDTRDEQQTWFRPESKKYMTVELEHPFVWPETPDLTPWGPKDRKREIEDSARNAGVLEGRGIRERARTLREQARELLGTELKERDPGVTGRLWKKKRREVKGKSALELWESRRPDKLIESDEAERFIVKA